MALKHLKRFFAPLLLIFSIATSAVAAQINTYGKLEIVADDRSFSARINGRVYVDGNFYRSDADNRKLTSGTFIRSARIGLSGNFRDWDYAVEYDNATDIPSLKDAYLRHLLGPGRASIGQFKVSESLEEIASMNDIAFMERPYVSEIVPGYQIGAGYNGTLRKFGFSGNIYNLREAAEPGAGSKATNSGVGLVARGYIAPINQKTMTVHLGASYAHENTDVIGARGRVRPAGRAEDYRNEEPFRFTIYDRRDESANLDRAIFEAAAINGPLYFQAEYLTGRIDTATRSQDTFTVWYAQTSYFLTGESRRYDFRAGRFERPKEPNRLGGAVEIAARYQQAERKHIEGAKLTTTEYGVTYYANMNVRYMVNYSLPNNKLLNDQPRLLAVRAQFDF